MSKENQNQVQSPHQIALKNWDNSLELATFFFTYTAKSIKKNAKELRFWQKVLLEEDAMDYKQARIDFERMVEMNKALSVLANKFSKKQILETLEFLAQGRSIADTIVKRQQKELELAATALKKGGNHA